MFGFFSSRIRRNQPVRLAVENPRPVYEDDQFSGNGFRDGYTRLSRADPHRQGSPPPVKGTQGPMPQGPDDSFEQ